MYRLLTKCCMYENFLYKMPDLRVYRPTECKDFVAKTFRADNYPRPLSFSMAGANSDLSIVVRST